MNIDHYFTNKLLIYFKILTRISSCAKYRPNLNVSSIANIANMN